MKNVFLISSSLWILILSISHLNASASNIICPEPGQIHLDRGINPYVWTAPGGWLGSGDGNVGNWENVTLEYYPELHDTVVFCHYKSDKGEPTGSINPLIGGVCYFKNGTDPLKTGKTQCTGKNPQECQVECLPFSDLPIVSASCVGDWGGSCLTSFTNKLITSPIEIGVTGFYNCAGGDNTGTLTVSNAPVCLKYSTSRDNAASFEWTNNAIFQPGIYKLDFSTTWCPNITFTFYRPINGKCSQ